MKIEINGMKYREHNEFYLGNIQKYLTIVFVRDISTGHIKEYADFLDGYATQSDIENIMRFGFKPGALSRWLTANLEA